MDAAKAYKKNGADFFNQPYTVSAECLYQELCSLNREDPRRTSFRHIFDTRLENLIKNKKPFNAHYLSSDVVKTIAKQPSKDYTVHFGVPIKKSLGAPLPLDKSITLDGLSFERISQKQFRKAHQKACLDDYHRKCEENLRHGENLSWILRDFCYFRTTVSAPDDREAANIVANAFEVLYACATVAQSRDLYQRSSGNKTRSRSVMAPAGLLLLSHGKCAPCELLWDSDIRIKSDESLDFTKEARKLERFKLYRRVCREDMPISKRVRLLLLEFAKALHAKDPHIRQLGLWRCLEIATSRSDGTRSEKEIIQILGHYYEDYPHWRRQGELIMNVRNKFVHQGASLENSSWGSVDKYLNWTQEYVSAVLGILLWMRHKKIGSKSVGDIDDFFDFYPKPDSALKIAGKLLYGRLENRRQQ